MTTHSDDGSRVDRSTTGEAAPSTSGDADTVEAYEDGGNVVFYDAENPLAWVETSRTLDLSECA